MTHQKNVTEQSNTPSKIEFTLELSPEQYEIYEMLAKLTDADDIACYIHDCINGYLQGSIDYIKDEKTRKLAKDAFQGWGTSMFADQRVILHGTYEPSISAEAKVVEAIAEGQGYKDLGEFIQAAIRGGVNGDIDNLGGFDGAKKMDETLKEEA